MDNNRRNHMRPALSLREIFQYIQEKFAGKKENEIERYLLESPFEGEAVEGLAGISEDEAREDLAYLRAAVRQRSGRKSNSSLLVWQIAAAVFLFGVFAAGIWFILDNEQQLQVAQEQNRELNRENKQLRQQLQSQQPADTPRLAGAAEKAVDKSTASTKPEGQVVPAEKETPLSAVENVVSDSAPRAEDAGSTATETLADQLQAGPATGKSERIAATPDTATPEKWTSALPEEIPQSDDIPASQPLAARMAASSPDDAREQAATGMAAGYRAITGVVVSAADRAPLAGVRISTQGLQSEVYTGLDGTFEVVVPADREMRLKLWRPGYVPTTAGTGASDTMHVQMQPESGERRVIIGTNPPDGLLYDPPTPLGGREAFSNYMESKVMATSGTDAVVRIRFTVAEDGSIRDIRVLSPDTPTDIADAVRKALEEGPPWYPAEKDGIPASDLVDLRIRY